MSRAFTKEIDDAPPPPVPDRPISAARNLVTANGARQIEQMVAMLTQQTAATSDGEALAALKRICATGKRGAPAWRSWNPARSPPR
ncbi:hypothetical protein LP421_31240 (plasmid) [Rhizobium sp. RCAM05350]|nr:hypothetical protein LP421_31240 [Rhizobium sp. RCAM05350]